MLVIYLIIGALSGLLSGLLGIGGGVIIVPALSSAFYHYNVFPNQYGMHMAIGTSLASIVITLLAALRSHAQRGSVRWDLVRQLLPGIVVGVVIGAVIAHDLSSLYLRIIFSVFLFYISYGLLFKNPEVHKIPFPPRRVILSVSTMIGALSSILGAGGGAMLIPFLLKCQVQLREATGTSVACGVVVGLVASISFMAFGLSMAKLPWSTGYIYWPAFMGISVASILFAPIGTAIAYQLPTAVLRRVFGIFLVLIAIKMVLN